MTTGKKAMLGMGNKSLTSGSAAVRIPIHQPIASPSAVPGINAIRKEAMSLPMVVPAWSHNSPPAARPKSVLTIFVGGGKKAARKKPAWTRASQAASATTDVVSGIVNSREKSQVTRKGVKLLMAHRRFYFFSKTSPDVQRHLRVRIPTAHFHIAGARQLNGIFRFDSARPGGQ